MRTVKVSYGRREIRVEPARPGTRAGRRLWTGPVLRSRDREERRGVSPRVALSPREQQPPRDLAPGRYTICVSAKLEGEAREREHVRCEPVSVLPEPPKQAFEISVD